LKDSGPIEAVVCGFGGGWFGGSPLLKTRPP